MARTEVRLKIRHLPDDAVEYEIPGDNGHPTATLTVWFSAAGGIESVKLEPGSGVTASGMQRFPWARWLAAADASYRNRVMHMTLNDPAWLAERKALSKALRPVRAPARGKPWHTSRGIDHYTEVAQRYIDLRAAGVANPTASIAKERQENRNTVAGWIRRCRQMKLLPPARPGRAG